MSYFIPKEVKSEVKIVKFIYLKDFIIIFCFMALIFSFEDIILEGYRLFYYIGSFLFIVAMLCPSHRNAGKKNYYSVFKFLGRDMNHYRSASRRDLIEK